MGIRDYLPLIESMPVPKGNTKAALVTVVEPRIGPWTGNMNLGSQRLWTPSELGTQTIWKNPEWGMPCMWTLSLGIDLRNAVVAMGSRLDMIATIVFGAGGTTQQIECDWLTGTSISLPGNAFEVIARFGDNAPASIGVVLSVLAAKGAIGVPSATRTLRYLVPASTTAAYQAIPNFAKWVSIVNFSDLAVPELSAYSADAEYVFNAANGGTVLGRMRGDMLVNLGGVIPIPSGSRYFTVTNLNAAEALSVNAVFGMAY